jgi:HD-like signal output (HDOD) protein
MSTCPFCATPVDDALPAGEDLALAACLSCLNPLLLVRQGAGFDVQPLKGASDVRKLAAPGSLGGELLKLLPKAIEELPILPEISQRVMAMLRDPNMSMRELADLVGQDQVIAVKILQLANSAMYGGLQEITSLTAACARLGTRTIANAVHAVANGELFITGNAEFRDRMHNLWRHSVATAHCASEVGGLLAETNTDMLFVAGLVHEIGQLVVMDIVSDQYRGPLSELRTATDLLEEVLRGYSALAGLHVVQKWALPHEFRVTTYFHSEPNSVPIEGLKARTHIVSLAHAIASVSGYGVESAPVSLLNHPSTKTLGLTDLKLAIIRTELEDKLEPLLQITSEG